MMAADTAAVRVALDEFEAGGLRFMPGCDPADQVWEEEVEA